MRPGLPVKAGTLGRGQPPGRRTTIRELADYTGLSPAAVSYALRGMQVSAETERRVREAAEELGYEADPIARALAGGSTAVVACSSGASRTSGTRSSCAPSSASSTRRPAARWWPTPTASPAASSSSRGAGRPPRRRPRRRPDRPGQRRLGVDRPGGRRRSRSATRCPGVSARRRGRLRQRARRAARASSTSARSATAASRCCRGPSRPRPTARPSARSRASAAALGLDCGLVACAYSLNGSRPLALELLGGDERPTAVLCLSDSIAYGVYAACAELGLSIPGDVAVAGFGDHPISRLLAPPLTSTVWDVDRVAELRDRLPAHGDGRRRPAGDAARDRRRPCSSRARRRGRLGPERRERSGRASV